MVSFVIVLTATTYLLHVWKTWMIVTNKCLLVDIFLTGSLSKSLAICKFASIDFKPCICQLSASWLVFANWEFRTGEKERVMISKSFRILWPQKGGNPAGEAAFSLNKFLHCFKIFLLSFSSTVYSVGGSSHICIQLGRWAELQCFIRVLRQNGPVQKIHLWCSCGFGRPNW